MVIVKNSHDETEAAGADLAAPGAPRGGVGR